MHHVFLYISRPSLHDYNVRVPNFTVCRGRELWYTSFKGLFTWSGGPRSGGVGFFCFHALGDTKQKKHTPLDRGPPLHVNRALEFNSRKICQHLTNWTYWNKRDKVWSGGNSRLFKWRFQVAVAVVLWDHLFISVWPRLTDPNFWHFQKKRNDVVKPFLTLTVSLNLKKWAL